MQDAEWGVTVLLDETGEVQERLAYLPYGTLTALTPTFEIRQSSIFQWQVGFGAYRWDAETMLYLVRNRVLLPSIGWTQRDPLKFADSSNLYAYVGSDPINKTDPFGEQGIKEIVYCNTRCYTACTSAGLGIPKCDSRPICIEALFSCGGYAIDRTQERFEKGDLRGDAWRHCFWGCLMVANLITTHCARCIGENHEYVHPSGTEMDLRNNEVGFVLGASCRNDPGLWDWWGFVFYLLRAGVPFPGCRNGANCCESACDKALAQGDLD
jgi:RHS repeat-associated protein